MQASLVARVEAALLWVCGPLTAVARCSAWAVGSWLQWLWCEGLVVPQHVGSSWIRDQTCVPCIGRQVLNHWTTREVEPLASNKSW